jgi:hypothetical protein
VRGGDDRGPGVEGEASLAVDVGPATGLIAGLEQGGVVAGGLQADGGGQAAEAAADDGSSSSWAWCWPGRWSAPPARPINDWFDRDVDAINEPHRPIPSGRMPGKLGAVYRRLLWTVLSLAGGGDGTRAVGLRGGRWPGWRWPGPTARRRCA